MEQQPPYAGGQGPYQGGPPPTPPRAGVGAGVIAVGVLLCLAVVAFLITGFVAPGFLRGDDTPVVTAPTNTRSTDTGATPGPTPGGESSKESSGEDEAYLAPMKAFVAKVNAGDAAGAKALTCKDDKSQRNTVARLAKALPLKPRYAVVPDNSGLVLPELAKLELSGTIGGKAVSKVPAAGSPGEYVYAAGVLATKTGSTWCVSTFTSGDEAIDGPA